MELNYDKIAVTKVSICSSKHTNPSLEVLSFHT